MKAERRHELKTNTLALALQRMPEHFRRYGGKLLLGLVILVLIIVLISQRMYGQRESVRIASDNLAVARSLITQLRNTPFWQLPPEQAANEQRQITVDARQAIDQVRIATDDPRMRAEALVAEGDLDWQLANLPQLPLEQIDPELHPEHDPAELAGRARESYQAVLQSYPNQALSVISARFGLAAIAEEERDWEAARQHYQAIAEHPQAAEVFRAQARNRLEILPQLEQPPMLGRPRARPTPDAGPMDVPFPLFPDSTVPLAPPLLDPPPHAETPTVDEPPDADPPAPDVGPDVEPEPVAPQDAAPAQ